MAWWSVSPRSPVTQFGWHVKRTLGDCMPVISSPVPSQLRFRDRRQCAGGDCRVSVDGMSAQYLEAGAGSPVLLLHGYGQNASSWRWVIPALARTYRCWP
jgi:hypothetical protein